MITLSALDSNKSPYLISHQERTYMMWPPDFELSSFTTMRQNNVFLINYSVYFISYLSRELIVL